MIGLDSPTPSRKKPLPAAIRDGRAYWRRLLKQRVEAAQAALAAGDLEAATEQLRRARICEATLRRWDAVEAQAARGEIA